PRGQRLQQLPAPERQGLRQAVGNRRAQDQLQGVARLRHGALGGNAIGAHRVVLGLGLGQIQIGGHSHVEAGLDQVQSPLAGFQGLVHQLEQGLGRAQTEVGFRGLGDQAQLDRAACLVGGQVGLVGGLAEIAHTAEEVQFEGRHAHARDIAAVDRLGVGPAIAHVGRGAGDLPCALCADGRQPVALDDAELGAGLFDTIHGNAQIAVVLQGQIDQRLQPGILEEIPPGRQRGLAGIARRHWKTVGHRRSRPVIGGCQRAGAQGKAQHGNGQDAHGESSSHHAWSPEPDSPAAGMCGAWWPSSFGLVLNNFRITTKKVGTKSTASGVAASMPPSTPRPTAFWLAAPAPLAITRGTTPRMKANEVIRIGRKRSRAASMADSARPAPLAYRSLANATIRMAFFAARPITVTIPPMKYTSLSLPIKLLSSTAPSMPSGTASITDSGMAQLSYRAASTMKTTRIDRPMRIADWLPAWISW